MTLSKLLVLIAAALPLWAASLQVSDSLTATAQPSALQLKFSGSLSIPKFDPALGTLNSIELSLSIDGNLAWEVIGRSVQTSFDDLDVRAKVSVLGVEANTYDGPVSGGGGLACGASVTPPRACRPIISHYNNGGPIVMLGTVTVTGATIRAGSSSLLRSSGDLPPLSGFLGTDPLTIPVSYTIDGDASNDASTPIVEKFFGNHTSWVGLVLRYNYTPI